MLLLDEPTNYLDLPSIEALEDVLADYDGTILLASHDRKLINKVATHLMVFSEEGVRIFEGNYQQYLEASQITKQGKLSREEQILLENRLAEVIGRLSTAQDHDEYTRLEAEYDMLLKAKS